jgi:hypothetical protein
VTLQPALGVDDSRPNRVPSHSGLLSRWRSVYGRIVKPRLDANGCPTWARGNPDVTTTPTVRRLDIANPARPRGSDSMHEIYLAIDGDDVGHRLEYLMLTNNSRELSEFSSLFQSAMDWLKEELVHDLQATVIFSGGDNLLAILHSDDVPAEALRTLSVRFAEKADCTLSIGLGQNPREAYFALKLAKTSGKNCIRRFEELTDE